MGMMLVKDETMIDYPVLSGNEFQTIVICDIPKRCVLKVRVGTQDGFWVSGYDYHIGNAGEGSGGGGCNPGRKWGEYKSKSDAMLPVLQHFLKELTSKKKHYPNLINYSDPMKKVQNKINELARQPALDFKRYSAPGTTLSRNVVARLSGYDVIGSDMFGWASLDSAYNFAKSTIEELSANPRYKYHNPMMVYRHPNSVQVAVKSITKKNEETLLCGFETHVPPDVHVQNNGSGHAGKKGKAHKGNPSPRTERFEMRCTPEFKLVLERMAAESWTYKGKTGTDILHILLRLSATGQFSEGSPELAAMIKRIIKF